MRNVVTGAARPLHPYVHGPRDHHDPRLHCCWPGTTERPSRC
ncbi:hypothetical protein [Streptomyces humi]